MELALCGMSPDLSARILVQIDSHWGHPGEEQGDKKSTEGPHLTVTGGWRVLTV